MAQFQVIQPETTYTGSPIQPLQKGLPKQTQSLCPDCSELIDARILEDGGKVVMEKHCPEPRRLPRHRLFRRPALPEDGGVDLRRQPRPREPRRHRRHPLSRRLRPVQPAHQPHRPGQRRPDQPLQSDLPGLLRQRQRRRLPLRAGFRDRPQDAAGPARPAPRGRPHRAVLGRRADHLPALSGCPAPGQGDGLLAHPGGHQRPQVHRPGIRRAVQGSRPAHALPPVRRRLRRRLPPHARRIAVGEEAAVHRERARRPG